MPSSSKNHVFVSKSWKDEHLQVGSVVYAPFPGDDPPSESFYWGKITEIHATEEEKTFSIEFHDGDVVEKINSEHLHPGAEALALMEKGLIDKDLPPAGYRDLNEEKPAVVPENVAMLQDEESEEEMTAPRRSGRERISTTITIGGHTVLRKNNYQVKGLEYVWGTDEDADKPKERKAKKQKTSQAQPRVYKPSEVEVARSAHNRRIMSAFQPKTTLRKAFLAKHVNLLANFCEPDVIEELREVTPTSFKPAAVTVQPEGIQATLRDYQMRGLDFMVRMYQQNLSCILGDEMGLGKTLQTISLLMHLKEKEGVTGPSLVICPLSVLSSWSNELQKWGPSLKVFRFHATSTDSQMAMKAELNTNAINYDVILTTYEQAKIPLLKSTYQRLHFNYLVLDEGHKVKGHETLIAQAVRKIHRGHTLLLTGTPLQNNLVELWSLLNFLYPEVFTTSKPFEAAFDLKENVIDKGFLRLSQKLLDLFMLRRLKSEVETLMPKKLETKVYCPLSKVQSFWYKSLLLKDLSALERCEDEDVGGNRHTVIRNLFMQLRKCCNHPFTVDERAEIDPSQTTLEDLVSASGKLSVLDMLLQSLFKKGHRSVLFSQFTMILDIIEDYCILRGWKYCRLDGAVSRARRNYDIRRFSEPDSPYFLFLVSTRSGGMGLNLQSADTCILFDSDWNPQSDIQAMGRVHRIGQTKTVHVYRLVSSGTVEERMLERAEKKLLLEVVNQESKETDQMVDDTVRDLSTEELFKDIKFGSQAVFGDASNDLPTWEDIDNITNRARLENDSVGKLTGGTELSANTFEAQREYTESQTFEGKDFKQLRMEMKKKEKKGIPKNLDGIAHLWQEISSLSAKRQRKNRIVQVASNGSGYGMSTVPVLASNNYDLDKGESSVFDRELSSNGKERFQVKKKKDVTTFENQDICQVCGDGGELILCPRCPCSLHLNCAGMRCAKEFMACSHHRCVGCEKNGSDAGGLLYPCHACPRSFCEDCLPEEGVTFLEQVDRFEKLGFSSSRKNQVYINCSPECEEYAKAAHGYIPPNLSGSQICPKPLDLAFNFGAAIDIDKERENVMEAKENDLAQSGRGSRRAAAAAAMSKVKEIAVKSSPPPKPAADILTISCPPGRLGIYLDESKNGRCQITATDPTTSKLLPGDTIVSLNGVTLPLNDRPTWIARFHASSAIGYTMKVLRHKVRSATVLKAVSTKVEDRLVQPKLNLTKRAISAPKVAQSLVPLTVQDSSLVEMAMLLPPGPLGVILRVGPGATCQIDQCGPSQTQLRPGDVIKALNGEMLPPSDDKLVWVSLLRAASKTGFMVTILRQNFQSDLEPSIEKVTTEELNNEKNAGNSDMVKVVETVASMGGARGTSSSPIDLLDDDSSSESSFGKDDRLLTGRQSFPQSTSPVVISSGSSDASSIPLTTDKLENELNETMATELDVTDMSMEVAPTAAEPQLLY